jgi:pimeloyl-ACP methyl ester carboxylesterase
MLRATCLPDGGRIATWRRGDMAEESTGTADASAIEYTEPPERVRARLHAIHSLYGELPNVMPKILEDPARFATEEDGPMSQVAGRLSELPAEITPIPSSDGETEELGGTTFTHRFVEAPGDGELVRWHIVESGPASGETVIFLHGVPDSWFQWHLAMAALSDRYRCIAVDLKGYGQSDKRTGDYRQEGVADQILALLDAVGVERFALVTHDRGTPPGDHIAAKVGERMLAYGRGQQHLWRLHPSLHPQERLFTSPMAPFILADARATVVIAYTLLGSVPVASDLLTRTISEFSHEGINEAVPRYFHSSSFRQEWLERHQRLIASWQCPVLLLQGGDDPGQPHEFYTAEDVLARLPDGSRAHIFDAGHFWPFEAPDETATVVRDFLQEWT